MKHIICVGILCLLVMCISFSYAETYSLFGTEFGCTEDEFLDLISKYSIPFRTGRLAGDNSAVASSEENISIFDDSASVRVNFGHDDRMRNIYLGFGHSYSASYDSVLSNSGRNEITLLLSHIVETYGEFDEAFCFCYDVDNEYDFSYHTIIDKDSINDLDSSLFEVLPKEKNTTICFVWDNVDYLEIHNKA